MTTIEKLLKDAGKFFILAAVMANAHGALTDIAQGPLVTSSSSTQPLKPNVFLMMDDSGSMGWDYMPDDATNFSNAYGFYSPQCNGVYYDPSNTHTAPIKADGITHYPDATFTAAPWDGYGVDKPVTTTVNLDTSFISANYYDSTNHGGLPAARAFYFTYSGAQTTNKLKNYANTNSTFYKECNSSIGSAPGNAVFTKHILGTTETTAIAISGSSSTSVSVITVGTSANLLNAAISATTSSSTMATNIATQINAKTATTGYSATVSSSTVTITGPTSAADFTPVITKSGSMTLTTDVFPITTASQLTNFANWYSYYRTRINMMKTATGVAFKNINDKYRVGFATMNNNTGTDFLNIKTFADTTTPAISTQRTDFYAKLYATNPGSSTPLLKALSRAGLLYAHKLPSNLLNTVAANDPIQYSCQQNFTILSTDGFWNDATNMTLKAQGASSTCSPTTTSVGNCDGPPEIRPMLDSTVITTVTATPITTVDQIQTDKSYTTTTPWKQIVTTVGAANSCILTAAIAAKNQTTSYMSDGSSNKKILVSLGLGATNPAVTGFCAQLSASGTTKAWICRGSIASSPTNPAVNNASVTDSGGTKWWLVSSMTGNSGCTTDNTAFGSLYSTSNGACPPSAPAVMGYTVTAQTQTATETATGTNTSVDNVTTDTTSTVTTVNGSSGAPVITTNSTSSVNVSNVTSPPASDTTGAYANSGSPAISCSATPPAPGTSAPSLNGSSSTTYVTLATTTLSSTSTNGTPTVTTTTTPGTSNTLADVAEYYYITDIRDASLSNQTGVLGTDVSANNVPPSGQLDTATHQHMTTFTLGLGARGSMVFDPNYLTGSSVDFNAVANGYLADTASGVCSWQSNGTVCNWPIPVSGDPTTIDDLWHAAVDGRGSYYSATNPATLSTGLDAALAGVKAHTGSSASASISNPNISSGDNFIFSSNFVSEYWYGRLIRQQLDLATGALSSAIDWEAGAQLATNTARNIYAYSSSSSNHLQAFNSTNFGSNANFATANISPLTQFCVVGTSCLTPAQQTAATGANLVSYLAGDRTNEGYPADLTKYYRTRLSLLGDIVNSQATYVKVPLLLYSDAGYADFVAAKAHRQSMIYVGANDGMLHAFYANTDMMDNVSGDIVTTGGVNVTGGQEAWAFIPTAVMPNLYKLADIDYASKHQYFVDGSPVTTDICPTAPAVPCGGTTSTTTTWKTILVEGLNAGGNSYFAMDITNPADPKALWQFTNANLGYSYGNPQVVKLGGSGTGSMAPGTWVVLLTSGYNNADGQGHLFVLNAYSGALLLDISTGVGSAANPSGLSKIIAEVINPSFDATVLQVYGGDLFGNLWRFDVNGNVGAAGNDAQLLAVLTGPTGVAQPITTKPEAGLINGHVVVFVGTGRYLGISDIDGTDTTQLSPNLQSVYGIMDPLLDTTTPSVAIYPNPRTYASPSFVQQTEFTTTCPLGSPSIVCSFGQIIRTSTNYDVSIPAHSGWYVDFPDSGERMNTDPSLELGLLAFSTNVPSASACSVGGYSYRYDLDYTSGAFPLNSVVTISAAMAATLPPGMAISHADGTYTMGVAAVQHTGSLSTAPIFIRLPNGNLLRCTNDSSGQLNCVPTAPPTPPGGARRVSWRELLQ